MDLYGFGLDGLDLLLNECHELIEDYRSQREEEQ